MSQGYLVLVLHAHLPFVRHPEHEDFLEESWLYEAVLESYIPLLWALERLSDEEVPYRLTLSLSPTLVAMLNDPLLRARFVRQLERLVELAEREVLRTEYLPELHETALFYRDRFRLALRDYEERWQRDLAGAFRRLAATGCLELITCAATHGYLPLLAANPLAVQAQVRVATAEHTRTFGALPRGFWLPECGFYPGVDRVLADAGVHYSFLESHALEHAVPRPRYGVFAPVRCPSGLSVLARDPNSTKQVWSSVEGYPGDADYREHYRDIGFDLDLKSLGPSAHPLGIRRQTGIKYHRVTGRTEVKDPYVRARALTRAGEHARDFCASRRRQIEWLAPRMAHPPVVVAPYDAELFGHWWFEGPDWLEAVLRAVATDPSVVGLATALDVLDDPATLDAASPSASSWGFKGYNEMWLNGTNDWIYPQLHALGERMVALAAVYPSATGDVRLALNQAARELLLAQASDWAFIMSQRTAVEYATNRTREHVSRFRLLADMIDHGAIDRGVLASIAEQDNPFPDLDYCVYRSDYGSTPSPNPAAPAVSPPPVAPTS
jgi:1,4-alpha-glucan branching enzyme